MLTEIEPRRSRGRKGAHPKRQDGAALQPASHPHKGITQGEVDDGFNRWIDDLSRVSHRVLTLLAAALFLMPLLWMVGASLRQVGLPPPIQLEFIPNPIVFTNYWTVATELLPFGSYLSNSIKVVAAAVPLTILTASWAGFAMSQIAPKPRALLVGVSVAVLLVPVTALWLTRFLVYKWIGVLDTLWALILPAFMGSSPFYVLIFYWTFSRIPKELYESARLEGAGAFRVWASIAMPLARPSITAVGVLSFVLYWSNFLDPLLYLNDQRNYTLPVGLQSLKQMHPTNFPLLMAGAVMITVPVIIMFIFAQKYFLQEGGFAVDMAIRRDYERTGPGGAGKGRRDDDAEGEKGEGRLKAKESAAYAFSLVRDVVLALSRAARRAVHAFSRARERTFVAGTYASTVDYWWDHRDVRALRRAGFHKGLRIFVTFTTAMLVTSTIMYRPDHDGYQGTHLFFMPRESWEMDYGRGKLYEDAYYLGMDRLALAEEIYGTPGTYEWEYEEYEGGGAWAEAIAQQRAFEQVALEQLRKDGLASSIESEPGNSPKMSRGPGSQAEEYAEAAGAWNGPTHGPVLRKTPHAPNLTGNTIPLLYTVEAPAPEHIEAMPSVQAVSLPTQWRGDVSTPPPRTLA